MRKSQVEQIKEAHVAYIMYLSKPNRVSGTCRFAIYLADENGCLEVLWPGDSDVYDEHGKERKNPTLLTHQCYYRSENWKYPTFHFSLSGWGYSKTYDLKLLLKQYNPEIEVFVLRGASPASASC